MTGGTRKSGNAVAGEPSGTGEELVRRVRKPTAPPTRVERPAAQYDRRRRRNTIEEQLEEPSE
jgi:hypothetical protein